MTEDFASDMYLLRDLLLLAQNNGEGNSAEWAALNGKLESLEEQATKLMAAVQHLKLAFNPANRTLMMGLWIASFVDPLDPPNGQQPKFEQGLTESDLINRAKEAGRLLNALFDALKSPHREKGDGQAQGEELKSTIVGVSTLKGVAVDLHGEYQRLGATLDRLTAAFNPKGGGGGESTYWPSNYVSSSSSSSSITYP